LVFEFVDKNLLEVITDMYPSGFPGELQRSTIFQILRAIDHCHKHDVIHRDIKPENILMNLSDMSVKLCDFGFSRIVPLPKRGELTNYVGTRWYRSPERLVGCSNYGPPVDIFSIGCIMAEIVDGEPLLPGDSEIDQLCLIQATIGPIPESLWDTFTKNPHFIGISIIASKEPVLEDRYLTKLPRKGVSLLRNLVDVDPYKRIRAEQAIKDPYFEKRVSQSVVGRQQRNFPLPSNSMYRA
jgi:cyclin-dependent kinase-like